MVITFLEPGYVDRHLLFFWFFEDVNSRIGASALSQDRTKNDNL